MTTYPGKRNPNWHGGRSVATNGYVVVLVGVGHHLANSHGYAYEHRVVAEAKLGRRLRPGEQVHHVDGDRQNNAPENLDVKEDAAHHRVEHRRTGSVRRNPGEPNRVAVCACGCGGQFDLYDSSGRPRRYITGHNPQEDRPHFASVSPRLALVVEAVLGGASSVDEVSVATGMRRERAREFLQTAAARGLISRRAVGAYGPPGSKPLRVQETVSCACGCGSIFDKYDASGRPRSFVSGHNARMAA